MTDWWKRPAADQVAELERLYRKPPPAGMPPGQVTRTRMYVNDVYVGDVKEFDYRDVTKYSPLSRDLDRLRDELDQFNPEQGDEEC